MNTIRLNTIGEVVAKTSGGAEINNQEKTIDITENGTTEVAPDSGFTGLSKVIVNTDVQGGEGGEPGGNTGVSSWKYYDISAFGDSIQQAAPMIIGLFHIMKCGGTQKGIYPCGVEISSSGLMYLMVAAGVDMSAPIYAAGFERIMTMEEYLSKSSLWAQCFQTGMVEITEEEFYNLNA